MINKFRIVAFYTKDTPYEQVIKQYLEKSLQRFPELQHTIYAMPAKGNWRANVAQKPQVVRMALETYSKENIVIIDADATIETYPELFDRIPPEFDFAALMLDWNEWYGYKNKTPNKELLSGTMFFRNNPISHKIVRAWEIEAQQHGIVEQRILQGVLKKMRGSYRMYDLPLAYCYIKTLPDGSEPKIKLNNPVIVHYQVSRQLKRVVS